MYSRTLKNRKNILAVAPMMDWTDRHCRYFHRLLTRHSLLYTEMVVADALIHGDVPRHLDYHACEHPVALQLGGSDPDKLRHAAELGAKWGYDEINLNVGCPSDRVQSGTFGACLMLEPDTVARCIAALKAELDIPVTVKCRIGVDDQDPNTALFNMADAVFQSGCDALWVHARKAWLQGLSPKENRDIPPLDYDLVKALKAQYRDQFIGINGGIMTVDAAKSFILPDGEDGEAHCLDGVMIGRAAYQNPSILTQVDRQFYGSSEPAISMSSLLSAMMDYTAQHIENGGRVHHVTRHMIGLFQGQPGARRFRQILSVEASKADADQFVLERAFEAVLEQNEAA